MFIPKGFLRLSVPALLLCLALTQTSRAATIGCMYACDFGDSFHITSIYDVDPITGAVSSPQSTGLGNLIGLELHTDGFLYAIRTLGTLAPGTPGSLYKINPNTGASTLVGPTGLAISFFEGDMAIDHTTGTLYGMVDETLFTVDFGTGAGTIIGTVPGFNRDISSIGFDDNGDLWAIDDTLTPGSLPTVLLQINPATAALISTTGTSIDLGSMGGMDWDTGAGEMYVMDSQYSGSVYAGTNSVYKLDTGTGNLTLVGALGQPDGFSGLTLCAPVESPDCMYTLDMGDSFHSTDLYDVDPISGMVSYSNNVGVGNTMGLEMGTDGYLYTVEITSKTLYRIDPSSGVPTAVGPLGISGSFLEGDLAFDPTSGILYGIGSSKLVTIDTSTGAASYIGTAGGPSSDFSYLSFDDAGVLYGIDNTITAGLLNTTLHVLNPATAGTISSMVLPNYYGGAGGMDYDPNTDQLYVLDSKFPGSVYAGSFELYTFDPITGVRTLVGPLVNNEAYSGLAVCPPAPPCVDPPANMVGWWTFDEPNTIASPWGGTITINATFDISGSTPNTGVRNGAASFGGSLNLSGGYVEVANEADLNFVAGEDFAIDAWVKTSSSGSQTIVGKRQYVGGPGYLFMLLNGRMLLQLADSSGWTNYYSSSAPQFNDGNWHFLAVSIDRDNTSGIKMYADGNLVATFNPTGRSGNLTNTNVLRIGSHSTSVSKLFQGEIDEVEIFERAVTEAEFDGIYEASTSGKCTECAVERSVAGGTSREGKKGVSAYEVVTTMRTFRDHAMDQTATGRYYRDLYSVHNWRIAWLMLRDEEYRVDTGNLFKKYLPTFSDIIYGKADYTVSQEMINDGRAWLERTIEVDRNHFGGGELGEAVDAEINRIDWNRLSGWRVQDLLRYFD